MPASTTTLLTRIAEALERAYPPPQAAGVLEAADGFVWDGLLAQLRPLTAIASVDGGLLQGVETQRAVLLANTRQFARGLPANNALLWGARGMGKSALVKAVHCAVLQELPHSIALIDLPREDLASLPSLLRLLQQSPRRFILFCDDLSFTAEESAYKALKTVLDGGLAGRPANVLFYATSNRRHLVPRKMIENESGTAIHPGEAVEEHVSLSDRFGLHLGFYGCDQETYLAMIDAYATAYALPTPRPLLQAEALEWAVTRGARSGRVAWQFIQDRVGKARGVLL